MRYPESIARFVFALIVFVIPPGILSYQYVLQPALDGQNVHVIHAYAPEAGGFMPNVVRVPVGETVTLRFVAMDVVHGVAIGPGLDIDLGHIDPGEQKDITVTFDTSGTYTYYCTTWCSVDHWRMRGVIEVFDPQNPGLMTPPEPDPAIQRLVDEGISIDTVHSGEQMDMLMLASVPSAERGALVADSAIIPDELMSLDWQRSHSPEEALMMLRPLNPELSESESIDLVAYIWTHKVRYNRETIDSYNYNCAACHGETGQAEGPAASLLVADPPAFADPNYMFMMRGDVLYAKIRRGGMGTDMPNFGTLFTREESWALVDYLWQLAFQSEWDE